MSARIRRGFARLRGGAPAPGPDQALAPAGFARDTALLVLGLALAQGIALAVMPVWSRLYGPAEFAAFGLFGAVASVVSMLLLLRYDTSIVIASDDAQARALVRLTLALAGGGGLLLAALSALVPARWQAAAGLAALGPWLPLAVLAGALAAAAAAGQGWANRQRDYARMSAARVAQAAAAAVAGTFFGVLGTGAGLLLAHALAAALGGAALRWSLTPAGAVGAAARAHRAAPRYLWPAALLDAVTQQLPLWLTVLWFGAERAGQFSLAWRVVALPVLVLAGAAGSVFYQRFAALAGGTPPDRAAARALLQRTWRAFALIGAVPALVLAGFGEPIFAWAFGARWADAGLLAAVLAPMLWAMLVSSPTSTALIVLGLQRWAPVFGVAMLLYRPAAFALGARAGSLTLALGLWVAGEALAIVAYNALLLSRLRPARG